MKKRTKILTLSFAGIFLALFLYLFLFSQTRFQNFCDSFFIEEMQSNHLTMHYTVADPKNYHIPVKEITLGSCTVQKNVQKFKLTAKYFTLKTIFQSRLSEENQRLYDLVKYSLQTQMSRMDFLLFEEPLTPSIGIQSQLPVLLAEYAFANESDVINYLSLLKCLPEYFDSIIELEKNKIANGLFMDETSAGELITYCQEFCADEERHFLADTFKERLSQLNLVPEKSMNYIQENSMILNSHVFPSYKKLETFLEQHRSEGLCSDGLYYLPRGTDYYAWLLRSEIGCEKEFEEIEAILENALKKEARTITELTRENPAILSDKESVSVDTSNPAALASYLSNRTGQDFPDIPSVTLKICSVPKSMEPHLSPAFYLVPPLDDWKQNTVYLNQGYLTKGISFFTTLAHESYPGHLYQTVYENSTEPHPIQRLLYFGGYTEGWATYAEQLSYFYAPISEELAALLSASRAMTLNLYSHLDLYIHAYGWTEEDCSAYLKKYGITNAGAVHDMFALVKQQPANYLKYYLGYLEICHLKEQAVNCLGSAFDLKEFHEFILSNGPAPFSLLEEYFTQWLLEQQKGFSALENPLNIS